MKNYVSHIHLLLSLLLYAVLCLALHPFLGYMLDSDGVAYLTIARRVAEGQFTQSINGLWSPLNSWLLAPFIQKGMDAWMAAKVMNAVFGGIVIGLVHFLFIRFKLPRWTHVSLLLALVPVMVHNMYLQMFGDVLQLIFVLSYLLILWSKKFTSSYWKTVLCAMLLGIGYYAKAYSLVFFLLHFAITLYWFIQTDKVTWAKAVRLYCTGMLVIVLCVLPWTMALHAKYGGWSLTGHAGKLNMSWQINSGKSFKPDIGLLIPPVYADSPSFWEDPYPSQDNLSTPFSSKSHFVRWIARIVHTLLIAIGCFNEISCLALAILLLSFYYFFLRKKEIAPSEEEFRAKLLILTILTLPMAYLMMHIETRYIWLDIFLLMTAGGLLIETVRSSLKPIYNAIVTILLAISFVVFPVINMENMKYKNKDLFTCAEELKNHGIQGSFTSNAVDAGRMWVVAYLSRLPFYTIERTDYSDTELIQEMRRYNVKYYLFQSENNKPSIRIDENNFRFLFKGEGFDMYELR